MDEWALPEAGDVTVRRDGGRAASASSVFLRFLFCFLLLSLGPMIWWQRHGWMVHHAIPPSRFFESDGFADTVSIALPPLTRRLTDSGDRNETSDLRLFAGPTQLGPGHTPPGLVAIRGGGLFDDWEGAVVVSAPDNRDPRTSGVLYSASYRIYPGDDANIALVVVCGIAALLATEATMLLGPRPWRQPGPWVAGLARRALPPALLFGIAGAVAILMIAGLGRHVVLASDDFEPLGGFAFQAALPPPPPLFGSSGDEAPDGARSDLLLTEDGHPLGPADAPHALIRTRGHGAYSFWSGDVVFSSSDGADPRSDGRSYEASYRVFPAPGASWPVIAVCLGLVMVHLFRVPAPVVQKASLASATLRRPTSLLRLGGLAAIYMLALLVLYGSLAARKNDTGGFKINFEYKVF